MKIIVPIAEVTPFIDSVNIIVEVMGAQGISIPLWMGEDTVLLNHPQITVTGKTNGQFLREIEVEIDRDMMIDVLTFVADTYRKFQPHMFMAKGLMMMLNSMLPGVIQEYEALVTKYEGDEESC